MGVQGLNELGVEAGSCVARDDIERASRLHRGAVGPFGGERLVDIGDGENPCFPVQRVAFQCNRLRRSWSSAH